MEHTENSWNHLDTLVSFPKGVNVVLKTEFLLNVIS